MFFRKKDYDVAPNLFGAILTGWIQKLVSKSNSVTSNIYKSTRISNFIILTFLPLFLKQWASGERSPTRLIPWVDK